MNNLTNNKKTKHIEIECEGIVNGEQRTKSQVLNFDR